MLAVGSVATAGDGWEVREKLGKQRCQVFGYEVEGSLSSWTCPAGWELPGGLWAAIPPAPHGLSLAQPIWEAGSKPS